MKTLYLLRHGKAFEGTVKMPDIDRPLMERGINDSYLIAAWYRKQYPVPGLVLSSSAIRALHTACIFCRTVGYPVEKIKVNDALYEITPEGLLSMVMETNNNIDHLVVTGHNPVITEIANWYLDPEVEKIPTAGMVVIMYDCESWKELKKAEYKASMGIPKNIVLK